MTGVRGQEGRPSICICPTVCPLFKQSLKVVDCRVSAVELHISILGAALHDSSSGAVEHMTIHRQSRRHTTGRTKKLCKTHF